MFTNGLDVAKMAMGHVTSGNTIINVFGGRGGADMMPPLFDFSGGRDCCVGSEFAEFGDSKLGDKLGDAQKYQTMCNGIIGVLATILGGSLGALMGGGMTNQNHGNSQVLASLVGNPFQMLA